METKLHLVLLYSDGSQNFVKVKNFFVDEEHQGRPLSAVMPENISTIRKCHLMIITALNHMIQKQNIKKSSMSESTKKP